VRAFAGRLKSDPSISPSTCYFTFPFVRPDPVQQARLEQAAQHVLDVRDHYPEETLASLYDPPAMPVALRAAHTDVDRLIDRLHRLRRPTEGARLSALLGRYEELTHAGQLPAQRQRALRRRADPPALGARPAPHP